jgi:hypothetical protein
MALASVVSVTSPTVSDLDIFGSRIADGFRESAQSWHDLLLDLRQRSLIQRRYRARRRHQGYRPQRLRYGQQPAGFLRRASHESRQQRR